MIDINDLNRQIDKKDKLKEEVYELILEKCHSRIKMSAAANNLGYCFYIIPKYIYGVPLYDFYACLTYLVVSLDKNGFDLKYTHPNLLFISWKGKSNPKDCKNIETKNREYKSIDEYKPKTNLIYNNSLLKKLDNNIKITKH
jgi:hypothetical protein